MANIKRQKRIELSSFDPLWSKSYILVHTMSFRETNDFRKEISTLEKTQKSLERSKDKLEKKIASETDDKKTEALFDELEPVINDLEETTSQMIDKMTELIKAKLVSGIIYDFEEKKEVAVEKEDIEDFDPEIIGALTQHVTGTYSKNA